MKSGGRPPEDVMFFPNAGKQDYIGSKRQYSSPEHEQHVKEKEIRTTRSAANDHENIPITLIMAWASLLCSPNVPVHVAAISTFTLSRVGFTFAYMKGLQPARTIFFSVGFTCTLTIAINGLVGALRL